MTKWEIGSKWGRLLTWVLEVVSVCVIVWLCNYIIKQGVVIQTAVKMPYMSIQHSEEVPLWSRINIESHFYDENGNSIVQESRIDPEKPMVALTFDDGPGPYTEDLLDILEQYDARATFFMLGSNINYYPDAVLRMKELDCEYGNHTLNHKNLPKLKVPAIKRQLGITDARLKKITGETTTLIRPPYGEVNVKVQKVAKTPILLWSMDTLDWKKKDAKKVAKYVMKHVEDGDIILLHDIHKTSVEAVEIILPKLIKKGYQIVTVSEMAEARNVEMKAGEKYFAFYPE